MRRGVGEEFGVASPATGQAVYTRLMHPETEQAMRPLSKQGNASPPFQLQRLGVVMEPGHAIRWRWKEC